MANPEPVAERVVCSLCGLNWDLHPKDASAEDCVRLLRSELARRPTFTVTNGAMVSLPSSPTWTKDAAKDVVRELRNRERPA